MRGLKDLLKALAWAQWTLFKEFIHLFGCMVDS